MNWQSVFIYLCVALLLSILLFDNTLVFSQSTPTIFTISSKDLTQTEIDEKYIELIGYLIQTANNLLEEGNYKHVLLIFKRIEQIQREKLNDQYTIPEHILKDIKQLWDLNNFMIYSIEEAKKSEENKLYLQALKYYELAISSAIELNFKDIEDECIAGSNRCREALYNQFFDVVKEGDAAFEQVQYSTAYFRYEEAYDIAKKLKNDEQIVIAKERLSHVYSKVHKNVYVSTQKTSNSNRVYVNKKSKHTSIRYNPQSLQPGSSESLP